MRKNSVKIVIKGLNQEKSLSEISKIMPIYKLKRLSHNTCEFEIDYSFRHTAPQILKEHNLKILSFSPYGIKHKIKDFFSRIGLLSAVMLILIFYPLQYSLVLKIKVFGMETGEQKELTTFVSNSLSSKFKWKINTKNLENKIKNEFFSISSVSVAIIGQTLCISVNMAQNPSEMEDEFSPIVSDYNGIITKINLIQGTLAVKEGDIVQEGDVLVEPYVIDGKNNIAVQPKAEIYADVWLEGKEECYDSKIVTEETGKIVKINQISLFGLNIFSQFKTLPEEYNYTEKTIDLAKNLFLPLKLTIKTYKEKVAKEIITNFEDKKDEIIESARQKALIFLQKNEIIISEDYFITENAGRHVVKYVLTVNRNIGENNAS